MSGGEIIPFGKYKGQPVEQLANDKEYAGWLVAQPWFVEKFANIHTLIVNNFKEPADTPEHNALQAKFLDLDFSFSVANHFSETRFEKWAVDKRASVGGNLKTIEAWKSIDFEVSGWDVRLSFGCLLGTELNSRGDVTGPCWDKVLNIELKPSMAEEFPGVLRQIKSRCEPWDRKKSAVIIENFAAKSVDFESARKIFGASDIRLAKLSEIEVVSMPTVFRGRRK